MKNAVEQGITAGEVVQQRALGTAERDSWGWALGCGCGRLCTRDSAGVSAAAVPHQAEQEKNWRQAGPSRWQRGTWMDLSDDASEPESAECLVLVLAFPSIRE